MPRLPRPATLERIEAALREHPLRTPSGVEKMPHLPRPATLAWIETAVKDHPLRPPPVAWRKSHACRALRPWRVCMSDVCVLYVDVLYDVCVCAAVYVCDVYARCVPCEGKREVYVSGETRVRRGREENQNPTKHVGKKGTERMQT